MEVEVADQQPTYVIDGTNVCWWYSNIKERQCSLRPLLTLLIAILRNGESFYVVFDAPACKNLEESGNSVEAKALEGLIREEPPLFFQVTGSTRADSVILHTAEHHGRRIISNDLYRDYHDAHPWLRERHTPRLIQGNLQPGGLLTLEKLPYGKLSVSDDFPGMLGELQSLIRVARNPELRELDRALATRRAEIQQLKHEVDSLADAIGAARAEIGKLRSSLQQAASTGGDSTPMESRPPPQAQVVGDALRSPISGSTRPQPRPWRSSLSPEEQAVIEANTALRDFLRSYRNYGTYEFCGKSWKIAVAGLQAQFAKAKLCDHCFDITYSANKVGEKCDSCGKGKYTDNPDALWAIINEHAPDLGEPEGQ